MRFGCRCLQQEPQSGGRRAWTIRPIRMLHFRVSQPGSCVSITVPPSFTPSATRSFQRPYAPLLIYSSMATQRPVIALVRARPSAYTLRSICPIQSPHFSLCAAFSTTSLRKATPMGPPPQGFRLPRKERWDESKDSSLDKASTYFLMTEMMRGMYVVLEQFFRPP